MKDKIRIKILGEREDVLISFAAQNNIKIYSHDSDLFVAPTKAPKLLAAMQKSSINCEITFCVEPYTPSKPVKRTIPYYKDQE